MDSIRLQSNARAVTLCGVLAGLVMLLTPAVALTQAITVTASVGMSLRVLSPVSSTTIPAMSMSVTCEGIATMQPRTSTGNRTSPVVASLSATDDLGPLSASFAGPARARSQQRAEVAVDASTLVGLGVLSADAIATTSPVVSYMVRLRETPRTSAPDTGVVHIRLRYVLTVAGT